MRSGLALMLLLCSGFLLWSSAFIALYAGHAYMCETGFNPLTIHIILGVLIIIHFAAFIVFLKKSSFASHNFGDVIKWLLVAGLIATLVVFLPALRLTPCL